MYCSQCGKKVMDTMLFCPFCGSPIVIPEQDEKTGTPAAENAAQAAKPQPDVSRESIFERNESDMAAEAGGAKIEFVPLDMNLLWKEPDVKEESAEEAHIEESPVHQPKEAIRLQGRRPDLSAERADDAPKKAARKNQDSAVPQRKFDPDDIFFDDDEDDEDDYEDDFDDDSDDLDDEFDFEEPESSSFFIRHIRGFVSLIMFAIVAAVLAGWAFSSSGQETLARSGFAWRADVYVEVALEAYQNGSYAQAGRYYAEAFERAPERYEYANSAGVAYYMANDYGNAESMARKAIDVNSSRKEAYDLLFRLYPDRQTRPTEIQNLLLKGYQLTNQQSPDPNAD